ncbi:MAG: hypothetical protein J1F07_03970 [Muribaculaceae bacterium]|nr:hypothetical protein [Muribaculaceae bacterium]
MAKKNIIWLLAVLLLQLTSCISNDMTDGDVMESGMPRPLAVAARIEGTVATRAATNATTGTDDRWSYVDFTIDDAMGFFASGGNLTGGNYGEAPFINQKLIYTGGTGGNNFRDPNNTQFSPTHMNGNEIYMYYPYTPTIDGEFGFELRTNTNHNGEHLDTARCIDFLSTRHLDVMGEGVGSSAALYGEFQHTFAELIIMRGEGFDKPKKPADNVNEWQIKAVLNTPITGIKAVVTTDDGWKCTPELVYDSVTYTDRAKAMEWDAWLGSNFYKTQQDTIGQNAWYIIVPTIGCQAKDVAQRPGVRTRVEYIELYDNDGNLQRVSSLLLSNGNSKYVDGGWRYPMEIEMRELVPTANPCGIVPWKPNVDLTDERKRGINDESEFAAWLQAYNTYLDDPNDQNTNTLLKYGDLYIDNDYNKSWHFYVLRDLDLSTYEAGTPIVPVLQDILDGQSAVYTNGRPQSHKITGLKTTLVGNLTGDNAIVQNFTFENPDVNYGDNNTAPVGIIANYMDNKATVKDCRINNGNLYNPDGPAGMVAGSVTSECTVEGCVLYGFLISSGTYDNIVGTAPAGYNSVGNNANNVTNQN